jgi:hypothetical protein
MKVASWICPSVWGAGLPGVTMLTVPSLPTEICLALGGTVMPGSRVSPLLVTI